jgi:phosphoserine aminotransferase
MLIKTKDLKVTHLKALMETSHRSEIFTSMTGTGQSGIWSLLTRDYET